TETTGLDANSARIIQIGAVRLVLGNLRIGESFNELVNPAEPIPPESTAIHGIHDDDIREASTFVDVSKNLEAFTQNAVIIGHSVGYDLAILKHEYGRLKLKWERPRSLDTMVLAQIANPMLAEYSIEAVSNWLGVEVEGRHTALGDALTTARIFLTLVPLLRSKGIRTLAEAERSSRSFGDILHRHETAGWLEPAIDPAIPAVETANKVAGIDSFPFRHRVRDVMSAPPLFAEAALSSQELGRLLSDNQVSSVYVKPGEAKQDIGIVTERDLMRVLTARDFRHSTAGEIMSTPLRSVSADAYLYQAITLMRQLGVRHLGVTDEDDKIVGALSSGDLLKQRAGDAILLGDELASAQNVASLAATWARLPVVARKLFDEHVFPHDIASIIAEELCTVTKRAAEIAEARMMEHGHGKPPVPFCLLVLGSGGRGESLLSTDQDNAIIYQSGKPGGLEDRWFEQLGQHVSDILNEIGVPYCSGGVMASGKKWRHSVEDWKSVIDGWIMKSDAPDLVHVDIFYDFRCVHGDRKLAQEIRHHAQTRATSSPAFVMSLARMTAQAQPPLGVFGRIRAKDGFLEIKRNTLLNITGGARTLALEHDVAQRSTRERLKGVQRKHALQKETLDNVIEAHKILLGEALEQQLIDIERGFPPTYKIELRRLPKRRKDQLRWALKQVNTLNSLLGVSP
ncbi:MAG: DUF294 nucleotidyltransferase-like domain-containing protein, partial [Hyphomicrobiaceae bacterium]